MPRLITYITAGSLIGFLVATLVSCGGGGDGESNTITNTTAQRTGTVGILITDKPADPSLFHSINATIERVELMDLEENDRVVLYSDDPKTVDLLRLKNESIPFTFRDDVPVGTYCKIRLTLSDLELVLTDDTPVDMSDNETYHPHLPGNGKLDLVSRDCFAVEPGKVVTLQIDMDGGNSIHIVKNGNGFNFRPVVFVDVLSADFESKLVRLEGEISEVSAEEGTLVLCDAVPIHHSESMQCVQVYLGDDSAFFDNLEYTGTPRPLDALLSDDMVGKQAILVGWPRHSVHPYLDVEIPDGHYPPLGECRLWHVGLEAGQQPPPGDCDVLEGQVTDDTVLVSHDGIVKDRYHPLMEVDALVVEVGDFLQVEGEVAIDADTTGFSMTVAPGGPVVTEEPLDVMLQAGEFGVNGTRIVTKSGELLDDSQIIAPRPIQVDGVVELTDTHVLLKAALVIIDTAILEKEPVTGMVLDVGTDGFVLSPEADTVCGIATTDLAVTLTEDAEFLTVIITDTVSEIIPGGTLEVGQSIGIDGVCTAEGYVTENVVILEDQRN